MTQEERRALFQKKAEAGNRRNNTAIADCKTIERRFNQHQLTINEALSLAWAAGCGYGKEHAEELKVFDNEKD